MPDFFKWTHTLIDIEKELNIWEQSDTVVYPADINSVSLSSNGNYIIVSRWSDIDIIDINSNSKHTINIHNAGHYTNEAFLSPDEKVLFQTCELAENAHFIDMTTKVYTDSIPTYPLCPKMISFYPDSKQYIFNYFDWVTTEQKSFMYIPSIILEDSHSNLLNSIVREKQNNYFSFDKTNNLLCYNNQKGNSWKTPNATFIGVTPDMQYVVVEKMGFRGVDEYQILDINSGMCLHTTSNDYEEPVSIYFLPYKELLKKCKDITKDYKLTKDVRNFFCL